MSSAPPPFPLFFGTAIVAAASVVPAIWVYTELLMGPCGDGLCGMWESLILWALLGLTTLVLVVIGAIRGERAWWLAMLAFFTLGAPVLLLGVLGAF